MMMLVAETVIKSIQFWFRIDVCPEIIMSNAIDFRIASIIAVGVSISPCSNFPQMLCRKAPQLPFTSMMIMIVKFMFNNAPF